MHTVCVFTAPELNAPRGAEETKLEPPQHTPTCMYF